MSTLLTAVKMDNHIQLRKLLQQCADVNSVHQGMTPLHEAVNCSNKKMVELLCEDFNADESIPDAQGDTPLDLAKNMCRTSKPAMDIVAYLTIPKLKRTMKRKHAPTRQRGPTYHVPPDAMLRTAAQTGDEEGVREAIAAGADIHSRNEFGATAVHLAAAANCPRMTNMLVKEFGADISMTKNWGDTALHWACSEGHAEMVKLLINELGADPNVQNHTGATPLHYAAYYGHFEVVRVLVEEIGADMEPVNSIGKTAMEVAQMDEPSDPRLNQRRRDVADYLMLLFEEDESSEDELDVAESPEPAEEGSPKSPKSPMSPKKSQEASES